MADNVIRVRGAKEHNLKNITLEIPRNKLVVFTGISGSGKSTLAMDTIFAEGQRRYLESLSSYARQFLGQMEKPDVEGIDGLSPTIAIDQKAASHNPRSTVGTVTEIYDYLRLLFARIGIPHCPKCGREIRALSVEQMVERILEHVELHPRGVSDNKTGVKPEESPAEAHFTPGVEKHEKTNPKPEEHVGRMNFTPGVKKHKEPTAEPEGTGSKASFTPGVNVEDVIIFAPVVRERKGEYHQLLQDMWSKGYVEARVNGKMIRLDEKTTLARYKQHTIEIVIDRLPATLDNLSRLTEAVEASLKLAEGLVMIVYPDGTEETMNQKLSCPDDGGTLPELEPRLFSFNSPQGACPTCDGLGVKREIDPELIIPDPSKTIAEGGLLPWSYRPNNWYGWFLRQIAAHYDIADNVRLKDLTDAQRDLLLQGPKNGAERIRAAWKAKSGYEESFRLRFGGIVKHLEDRYRKTESPSVREEVERYMASLPCPDCHGQRLKHEALLVKISGATIAAVTERSVESAIAWFDKLTLSGREKLIAERLLIEIRNRLRFLSDVGLNYLTLDRAAMTLSGGESQRIRLASQVGSALVGVLYILDEPTIGLHARDNVRLITTLEHLRDIGNSVLVIEHDQETIERADWVVDIGPGAGRLGGEVIASGPPSAVKMDPKSLTGRYLRGEATIPIPPRRRTSQRLVTIVKAREHNLKNLTVSIPLGLLVCVTGVSGSGKSTLVNDIFYSAAARLLHRASEPPGKHERIEGLEQLDKVIVINQAPIGRTPRSNPATYTGLFTPIRELFASTKDAKVRGFGPGRFSFNVAGGRCDACAGDGFTKIEMQFLPDVYLPCEICHGDRYNRETLTIRYREKSIAEVLRMTVDEALEFFGAHPSIADKLQTLTDVGLGYISLGQSATTLSGGEAQRIKLASELSKRATGRTLYVLDEPTTGLHFDDVRRLLEVIHRLVDHGNSVVVIEHNLDVIKTADWVIDLGPEGGAGGGELVAEGTPEEIARHGRSYTGQYLKKVLSGLSK